MVVRRLKPLPIEAIARGYVIGSGWKDYQRTGAICGIALPAGLREAERLPQPIFTPSTKAPIGKHDENIPFAEMEVKGAACFIAAAGGAAHLAGVVAAKTQLPVLGVPMPSKHLQGFDSLLSMVQMPKGIPVATFAIGEAGAANAALFAVAMLALEDAALAAQLAAFRASQTDAVVATKVPD